LLRAMADLDDLLLVHEQFALAPGGVVGPRARTPLGDVHRVEPDLAAVDERVAVDERGLALTQRLHLGTREHDAGLVGVLDEVVVARLPVGRDDLLALPLGHDAPPCALASAARRRRQPFSLSVKRCSASRRAADITGTRRQTLQPSTPHALR